ncbi:hypothetical protein DW088_01880 [Butyricicoccus sp. AM05-1]|uniref:hypothetical protein n=1 Tax=Butyricicoccus sp. AM05-1 TaxID=2292004 RepID=UPI000E46E166|nr:MULTISPECIES: hypothetical protein [unclassified Butyricicoccus]RHO64980.1 hypothetical protein DW088_01880 [Butyricicoccus sp. AM05-1]
MAKKRVPERGSEEERRYYLTKEGLKDFDSYKEFDWRRALELLFEDAPDVNWQNCSANDFKELRDKGVITEEECDMALSIGSRMLSQALHFPETPLHEKILIVLFGGPWSIYLWVFIAAFVIHCILLG